jgi:hypothetical protein
MSDDTRQLLHAASPQPDPPDDFDMVWARARRQRRTRQVAAVLGAAGVLAVASVMLPGMLEGPPLGGLEIVGEPDQANWPDVRGGVWRMPLDAIPQGVTTGVVEDRQVFFVRDGETVDVLLAAAQHLPNEGLWWCPDEQLFASPAHGELFDRDGQALFGPADRDLDRLTSEVRDGTLLVDPATVLPGGPAEPADAIGEVLPAGQAHAYEQAWNGGFCAGHQPEHDPPSVLDPTQPAAPAPDSAVPVDIDRVPRQLRDMFVPAAPVVAIATDPTGSSDRRVVATPQADPPLLFGTSCDLVSAVPLPTGWLGYCLERTHDGQRISSLFPWGTTSTPTEQQVHVPDVVGLALDEAQQILRVLDLEGRAVSGTFEGRAWQDPDDPDAVVVSQTRPAGTLVRPGEIVGFRTALIDPELCAVLTALPPRQGDAMALTATDGYWDVLERARPHAAEPLAGYLDELLAHHDAGLPTQEAPGKSIDSVAIHHDACSRR